MFGYAARKIDFDYVKLVTTKIKLNIKWFIFEYINVKLSWIIDLGVKMNYKI